MVDKSPVAGIPMGYIYFAGAIGAAGMGIVLIIRILQHLKTFGRWHDELPTSGKEA